MRYQSALMWPITGLGEHFAAATAAVFRAVAERWATDTAVRWLRQAAVGPISLGSFMQNSPYSVRRKLASLLLLLRSCARCL